MMERLIFVRNSLVALLPALAFVWCLFFEYLYHRWFQHRPGTIFADKHHLHHATYRRENEEEHLNFGGHPIYVALLFIVNGAPLVAVDLIFHTRWFPPAMLIFVGYVIVMEDIHYRIHTDLWVPFNLHQRISTFSSRCSIISWGRKNNAPEQVVSSAKNSHQKGRTC